MFTTTAKTIAQKLSKNMSFLEAPATRGPRIQRSNTLTTEIDLESDNKCGEMANSVKEAEGEEESKDLGRSIELQHQDSADPTTVAFR